MVNAQQFISTLQRFFGEGNAHGKDLQLEGLAQSWGIAGPNSWAMYTISGLQLDTDGPDIPGIRYDQFHQGQTSLRWPDGSSIDSNKVPYLVLPGHFGQGIALGDVGLVQYFGNIVPIITGDIGPERKYGEGSIALHRLLGFERIRNGAIVDVGIDANVRAVLFPGTGVGHCLPIEEIAARAWAAWDKLTT